MDERIELIRLVAVWLGFFMISSIILVCLWGFECHKSAVLKAKYESSITWIKDNLAMEENINEFQNEIEQNARLVK